MKIHMKSTISQEGLAVFLPGPQLSEMRQSSPDFPQDPLHYLQIILQLYSLPQICQLLGQTQEGQKTRRSTVSTEAHHPMKDRNHKQKKMSAHWQVEQICKGTQFSHSLPLPPPPTPPFFHRLGKRKIGKNNQFPKLV